MTDQELRGFAQQCVNFAQHDIERERFNFVLACYHAGEGTHRMRRVEQTIVEILGDQWLNDGRKKDAAFDLLKYMTHRVPPTAVGFATAGNCFTPTPKFLALPAEEQRRMMEAGHNAHHKAAADGYLQITDVIIAVAQNAQRVCYYTQERGSDAAPTVTYSDQSDFGGRMKLYGCDPQEYERVEARLTRIMRTN